MDFGSFEEVYGYVRRYVSFSKKSVWVVSENVV